MELELGKIKGVCICLSADKTQSLPHLIILLENGHNALLPCMPMGENQETPDILLMQYFDVRTTEDLLGIHVMVQRESKDSLLITTLALPKKSAVFHA